MSLTVVPWMLVHTSTRQSRAQCRKAACGHCVGAYLLVQENLLLSAPVMKNLEILQCSDSCLLNLMSGSLLNKIPHCVSCHC